MEYYYQRLLNNRTESTSNNMAGHNGNCNNNAWELWDQLVSSSSSSNTLLNSMGYLTTKPDPHLTCLKLGMTKKGRPGSNNSPNPNGAPRCQVEGCELQLDNAKDYHKRHKVCEMHAKSPKVVVLGIEQRFCQQCSRFHVVAEFDEFKRSCRRRLAGHNERRRKSSQQHLNSTKPSRDMKVTAASASRHPHFPYSTSSNECALSLLSSTYYNYHYYTRPAWNNTPTTSHDLPTNCGTTLLELIAENRASCMQQHINSYYYDQECGGQLTLELKQSPTSASVLLSDRKTSEEEGQQQQCSELWKLPLSC